MPRPEDYPAVSFDVRQTASPVTPGAWLDYAVVVNDGPRPEDPLTGRADGLSPLLYVPGFNDVAAGFRSKIGLAARLAEHGLGMVMAQNDRRGLARSPANGHPDAMHTQALNVLAAVEAESLEHTTLPSAGYSMGGMVLTAAIQEAKRRGWTCFDDAPVALLASAGLNPAESLRGLAIRFVAGIFTQRHVGRMVLDEVQQVLGDSYNELIRRGVRSALSNPGKTAREVYEQATRRIHLAALYGAVGRLAVKPYGADALHPSRFADQAVGALFQDIESRYADSQLPPDGIIYATPYSTRLDKDGQPIGRTNAHHVDCATCPSRPADALAQFILGDRLPLPAVRNVDIQYA